jgi:phospholipase/carboxylesterase
MMAAGVLLRNPEIVDAVWLMSGRLIPQFDEGSPAGAPKPILVQHGSYDDVLPPGEGRGLAALLKERGHNVEFHEYTMGHQISDHSLSDARIWLAGILGPRKQPEP